MITGNSEEEVHNKLSEIAFQKLESIIDNKGFSIETLRDLTVEELQEKLNFIDSVLGDLEKLKSIGRVDFKRGVDFDFPVNIEPYTIGYGFNPHRNFLNRKKAILEIIKTKNRIEKINSLEDLINNVSDNELKKKIEIELSALSRQTSEIEEKERQLTKEEKEFESSKKQLEISKSKLELLEKKSQIWLSIFSKRVGRLYSWSHSSYNTS